MHLHTENGTFINPFAALGVGKNTSLFLVPIYYSMTLSACQAEIIEKLQILLFFFKLFGKTGKIRAGKRLRARIAGKAAGNKRIFSLRPRAEAGI